MYRYRIELVTIQDVQDFCESIKEENGFVDLEGKDENGHDWKLSAKSLFGSLVLARHAQENRERKHTAHEVDWNTIDCVSENDIYSRISKWVKGNQLEP